MSVGSRLDSLGEEPPIWTTLPSSTVEDYEKLDDVGVIAFFDMMITSDREYAERLLERGLSSELVPVFRERLVLVGPAGMAPSLAGMSTDAILRKIFDEERLFFSPLSDRWIIESADALWASAGVENPGGNRGYVETGRDNVSALLQAGDENGFMLTGEASFAQYLDVQREEVYLAKLADTDYFRETIVCIMTNAGFRKERTRTARKYLEWLRSEEGQSEVGKFSMGGVAPFAPAE
jgi:ABC-type tungstate transport system permease subunit